MSVDLEALRRRYDGVNHCWDCGGVIVNKRDAHGSFEACDKCGGICKVTGILRKDEDPDVLALIDEVSTLRAQLAEARTLRSYVRDSVDETWEALPAAVTEAAISAVVEALGGDAYDCVRVWSAWSYGTMGPDDFVGIADDSDRVAEIAKEVTVPLMKALLDASGNPSPIGGWEKAP